MNKWINYANEIQKNIGIKDKLTLIPMLNYADKDLPSKILDLLREEFSKEEYKRIGVNEDVTSPIVIIDPYFNYNEFDFLIKAIIGNPQRIIEIFTMLKSEDNSYNENEKISQKETNRLKIENISYKLILQKFFKDIIVYNVNIGIHDRYIFCPNSENLFFSLGGSINTKFKKYSNILRISDFSMKMQVLKLYQLLKSQSERINEY